MPSLCERIEIFLTEGEWLTPYISFLNSFMKRLGACLVFAVHIITALLAFTSFAIILPYEQLYQRFELLGVYSTIGVYLLINIVFHYNKARTLPPVTKAGKPGDRWCHKCEFYKSDRTHHCAVCGKCVLGMDHHCIWINQCVGSHNHRHFFLFIVFLTWATFIIVTAGFHAIWDHLWLFDVHFCNAHLVMAPLQEWLCSNGELARNLIILTYFLSLLLFLLVGGLTLWNFYLISKGFTYIDYLKHSDAVAVHPGYRNPLDKGFKNNWKTFLGLRRNRTFLRHVLLPSSHPAIHYDSYGRIERMEQQIDIV